MSFRDRLRATGRLSLVQTISILYASKFVRLLVQRRRNMDHYSEGNQKLFEIELSKISVLDPS
jgi:hypothetical protein